MNERLKQIMLEHGLHKHISEDCQHRMEMLYELIVKECAELSVTDWTGYTISEKIKQHFGVGQ